MFVSYHHENDQAYRDRFERLFACVYDIMESRSVQVGRIQDDSKVDEIRRRIRDSHLRDSTVTVVLVGIDTWRRKHIDWEIAGSIGMTKASNRSGLLGVLLPSHPSFRENGYDPYTIPPRLHYNVQRAFAQLVDWTDNPIEVSRLIHEAFDRRSLIDPHNSYPLFKRNRRGTDWRAQKLPSGS